MEPICGYLLQTTTSAAADLRLDRQGKYTEIEKTWENTFQLHNWWIRLLTFAKRSRTVSPIFFDYLIIPLGISCRIRWVELHPVILYLGVPLRLGSGEGCVFFLGSGCQTRAWGVHDLYQDQLGTYGVGGKLCCNDLTIVCEWLKLGLGDSWDSKSAPCWNAPDQIKPLFRSSLDLSNVRIGGPWFTIWLFVT